MTIEVNKITFYFLLLTKNKICTKFNLNNFLYKNNSYSKMGTIE